MSSPGCFGCDGVGIAGSEKCLAVTTSIGETVIHHATGLSLENTLDIAVDQLALSGDDSVLAVRIFSPSRMSTLSLPAGTLINASTVPVRRTSHGRFRSCGFGRRGLQAGR